jgi:hypothetical protein
MPAAEKPATIADIRRLLAGIDDVTAAEILKLEPNVADLDEAIVWLAEGDDVQASSGRPHRPIAAAIVEMIAAGEEDDDEAPPAARTAI